MHTYTFMIKNKSITVVNITLNCITYLKTAETDKLKI